MAEETKVQLLILPQGFAGDLTGTPLATWLADTLARDAERLRETPRYAANWRPFWQITGWCTPDELARFYRGGRPSLGQEMYRIAPDGTLQDRQVNWDSSD